MAFIPDYGDDLTRQNGTPGVGTPADANWNTYDSKFGNHVNRDDDRNDQPVMPGAGDPTRPEDFDMGGGGGAIPPVLPPTPITLHKSGPVFSDEGGDLVTLVGSMPFAKQYGYYYIRLKRAMAGAEETVHPTVGYCYSAVGGDLYKVYPSVPKDRLTFGLPPLPLGLYKVVFYDGPSGNLLKQTSWLIKIERRRRSHCTYRGRNRFPPLYLTGPSHLGEEAVYPKP